MGKVQTIGLGFVTGRANVCNILNNTYLHLIEQFKDHNKNVEIIVFILFDTEYQGTPRKEFYKVNSKVQDYFKIIYITPESLNEEKDVLLKNNTVNEKEFNLFFGHGHAKGRNTVMYFALKNKIDYLLFWDDDEYPVACIKDEETNNIKWIEQDNIYMHVKHIDKADVTIGHHCGYISPIPYVELGQEVDQDKFKCFIRAMGNDIISWDSIREKFVKYKGITYADYKIANGEGVYEIQSDGVGKWVAGSTLCLNLNHIEKIPAFYNPIGARGEDTFFSTKLNNSIVLKIPVYHFHDGFLKYTNIAKGEYPEKLRKIRTTEQQIESRFLQASKGWIKYKPLLEYIKDNKNYKETIKETYENLKIGIPEVNKLFENNDFSILLNELEEYDRNVGVP